MKFGAWKSSQTLFGTSHQYLIYPRFLFDGICHLHLPSHEKIFDFRAILSEFILVDDIILAGSRVTTLLGYIPA